MVRNRSNITRRSLLLIAASLAAPASLRAQAQQRHFQVATNDARPLASVALELEQRHGWTITYEDPPYEFADDAEDVTSVVRRDFRNDARAKVFVPRLRPFGFEYDLDASPTSDPTGVLRALLDRYHQAAPQMKFRLVRTGEWFHIVPDENADAHGNPKKRQSLLDTRISIDDQPRDGLTMLRAIARAISGANTYSVVVGTVPINLLTQTRVRSGARDAPARNVLMETLAATGARLSWKLFCEPGSTECALNVHGVQPKAGR